MRRRTKMVPIGLLAIGEKAKVHDVGRNNQNSHSPFMDSGRDNASCQLESMGLRAGQTVEMLSNSGKGPILLKVDNSRIAIDRGMAMKIKVSMQEER
jgi:ferrous iron transport protein A